MVTPTVTHPKGTGGTHNSIFLDSSSGGNFYQYLTPSPASPNPESFIT